MKNGKNVERTLMALADKMKLLADLASIAKINAILADEFMKILSPPEETK